MTEEEFHSRLEQQYEDKLPFAVYRKPGISKEIKGLLQKDSKIHTIMDYKENGFVFAPFDDEKPTFLIPVDASEKISFEGVAKEETTFSEHKPRAIFSSEEKFSEGDKENHIALVEKGISALKAGEMQKVVLSRKEKTSLKNTDFIALFQDLLATYPTAFVYCWFHPQIGLWLGATPETLFKIKGHKFETMALAGTQKFEGTMEVNWGKKEKQEQQFVTDSIMEKLVSTNAPEPNAACPLKGVSKSETYTSKAGNLLHLRTDISGNLKSKENLKELIEALHPTPAVCGLPKEKAKKFILSEENYDREFYTGFLGELNFQDIKERSRNRRDVENNAYRTVERQTSLFVNLRCMKIEDGNAVLFVGGGITRDSIAEDEWEETVNKAETMKRVLLK